MMQKLIYTGEIQPNMEEQKQGYFPYLPSPELKEVVELAIYLERPLLIKGEPGCGKTRLAYAVAYEFGQNYLGGEKWPLHFWPVKSTSRAEDGLYRYDAIGRLRDAQLARTQKELRQKAAKDYIEYGPLGKAFQQTSRAVVLIDEIDKADIDFPNDLLSELEDLKFEVKETGESIKALSKPIVFITSNDEKDLPDAFLRRCIFHYIKFPLPVDLIKIVQHRFPELPHEFITKATERFLELRKHMEQEKGEAGKRVSTSELIDWVNVLCRDPQDEILAKLDGRLPYLGVLLKNWEDHLSYLSRFDAKRIL